MNTTLHTSLHTVNKTPWESDALTSCLRVIAPGSAVLLIENAVSAALVGCDFDWALVLDDVNPLSVFVLREDLIARGLQDRPLQSFIHVVDYAGWVDLVASYHSTQAWF